MASLDTTKEFIILAPFSLAVAWPVCYLKAVDGEWRLLVNLLFMGCQEEVDWQQTHLVWKMASLDTTKEFIILAPSSLAAAWPVCNLEAVDREWGLILNLLFTVCQEEGDWQQTHSVWKITSLGRTLELVILAPSLLGWNEDLVKRR